MRARSFLLLLLCAAGCGTKSTGADLAMLPDLSPQADLSVVPQVDLHITMIDYASNKPLAGVNICIAPSNTACVMSAADGTATLMAPGNTNVLVSYSKNEYASMFTESATTDQPITFEEVLITPGTLVLLAAVLGLTIDDTAGVVIASTENGGSGDASADVSGVSYTVTPKAGVGPYYIVGGLPSKTATSTGTDGVGYFVNLPPGDYDVAATVMGKTCTPSPRLAWPGMTASSSKAQSIAGGVTSIGFVCM